MACSSKFDAVMDLLGVDFHPFFIHDQRLNCVKMRESLNSKLTTTDITFLCNIGIRKGNNVTKILSTLPYEDRTKLQSLREILGLQDKSFCSNNAITLSRVMACFPEVTISIVHREKPRMPLAYEKLQEIHVEFPHIARVQAAASVIPVNLLTPEELRKALALFLVSSLKTDDIYRSNEYWKTHDKRFEASSNLRFLTRALYSHVLGSETRIKMAIEYEIVVHNGRSGMLTLTEVWRASGEAALTWLQFNYNFDLLTEPISRC